jgi:hypothetical protein
VRVGNSDNGGETTLSEPTTLTTDRAVRATALQHLVVNLAIILVGIRA